MVYKLSLLLKDAIKHSVYIYNKKTRNFEHFKNMLEKHFYLPIWHKTYDIKQLSRGKTTQKVQESFWGSFLIMSHAIKKSCNY